MPITTSHSRGRQRTIKTSWLELCVGGSGGMAAIIGIVLLCTDNFYPGLCLTSIGSVLCCGTLLMQVPCIKKSPQQPTPQINICFPSPAAGRRSTPSVSNPAPSASNPPPTESSRNQFEAKHSTTKKKDSRSDSDSEPPNLVTPKPSLSPRAKSSKAKQPPSQDPEESSAFLTP